MMKNYRKNALVFDFNVMPVFPELDVIQKFFEKQVQLDLSSVQNLQVNLSRNQVIIETTTPEQAFAIAREHHSKHYIVHQKKRFQIPIYVEDETTEVKIHDLPPRMPNQLIVEHLLQYGEVKSIFNEVWRDYFPGLTNGVRIVRMNIKKPIPSYLSIEGNSAFIVHKEQIKTCRHCNQSLHPGQKCKFIKTIAAATTISTKFSTTSEEQKITKKTTQPEKDVCNINTQELSTWIDNEDQTPDLIFNNDPGHDNGDPLQTTNESIDEHIPANPADFTWSKGACFQLHKKKAIYRRNRK